MSSKFLRMYCEVVLLLLYSRKRKNEHGSYNNCFFQTEDM